MCGIAGFMSRNGDSAQLARDLARAVACLRHRGPDDEGLWNDGAGTGLGFRRLSILDLSERGHQPMRSKDGRYVMVFNGEVYNFAEVRARLLGLGHLFSGTGDSEVILTAFQQWGERAVDHFIGMFAIGLWDEREQTMHLFRDRVGVKPLYYGWDGTTLWFGSELKALRAFGHWRPRVDRQAVGEFLHYGYISSPRSIYTQVKKLPPGSRLALSRTGDPVVTRYWSLLDALGSPIAGDDDAIEAELEALLASAFQYRMVADVPVGVFLSGGVDSSLVTAILAREATQPIRTFTIGFAEDHRDESAWARKVANHLGTRHTEYILGVQEALAMTRDWGTLFDEPFGDASGIPTLLVSRLARAEVTVALSADGGDELFMGYSVYDDVLGRLDTLARVPSWLKTASAHSLSHTPVGVLDGALSRLGSSAAVRGRVSRRIRRARAIMHDATPDRVYDAAISYWLPEEVRGLMGDYSNPRTLADAYRGEPLERMCLWDFHHYLPDDIMTKVDRTTMAVSLEGREPMLDHRLAEFAFRLPSRLRRGPLGPKHILKKILYRHVPRELVDRPKQGFAIPLEGWLRDDLRALAGDYLAEARIRNAGYFDARVVRRLVDDFYRGNGSTADQLWFLLAFELWREKWGAGVDA
ncbi:MAG TPA: asparagine synthase (glutamine-hydrolyzing) [Candidatus Krumholzibacteria bacterium]|nr:asparagine synthase (glutamine-hydrolyzing) [Candidatus Krumholzibacteria bacterium]